MRRTAYERAVEINRRLEYLRDLGNLLVQAATHTHVLTATKNFIDIGETERNIHSESKLDPDIRDKFLAILHEEEKQLISEFDAL